MTHFNVYFDDNGHLPNDGQPNTGIKVGRETVARRPPQKAKAAFQWNTASVLLPRLVDELVAFVARPVACGKDDPTEDGRTRIQCRFEENEGLLAPTIRHHRIVRLEGGV